MPAAQMKKRTVPSTHADVAVRGDAVVTGMGRKQILKADDCTPFTSKFLCKPCWSTNQHLPTFKC